jgi:hypothetical protein
MAVESSGAPFFENGAPLVRQSAYYTFTAGCDA